MQDSDKRFTVDDEENSFSREDMIRANEGDEETLEALDRLSVKRVGHHLSNDRSSCVLTSCQKTDE